LTYDEPQKFLPLCQQKQLPDPKIAELSFLIITWKKIKQKVND
jgi:hypothetical protein